MYPDPGRPMRKRKTKKGGEMKAIKDFAVIAVFFLSMVGAMLIFSIGVCGASTDIPVGAPTEVPDCPDEYKDGLIP